jgi:ACS family tartrate transporter-like MFS transporter
MDERNRNHKSAIVGSRAMKKITKRFLPLLLVCFIVSFLDRVNIGFASLTMNATLGLSASQFGLGAGLFFITYVIAEVPSNLALERYGARIWIARIMVTWGLLSAATAFVQGPTSFYVIRLLLGAAEAGFFPGIIFFLTHWVPPQYRGRFIGSFMAAMPIASVIGSPVSGLLLGMDGVFGLHGWQWLFIIEALPAIVLAPVVYFVLVDKPENCAWLDSDEKAWLSGELGAVIAPDVKDKHEPVWKTILNPTVLSLAVAWFGFTGINYGLSFFLPQIIAGFGTSHFATGLLSALPFAVAGVAMVLWGVHSDRKGERRLHICSAVSLAIVGLAGTAFSSTLVLKLVFLCLASAGVFSALPLFWSLPPSVLPRAAYAAGIAAINATGNLSGFVQPALMGYFRDRFGGFEGGLASIALFATLGTVIIWHVSRRSAKDSMDNTPQHTALERSR